MQLARFVDMVIFFLVRDDAADEGWQSGFTTARILRSGGWSRLGGPRLTNARGVLTPRVRAPAGSVVQLWSVRDRAAGLSVRV